MSDLIDRQAAIDALDQIFDRCEEIEAHLPEGDPDRTGYKMYPDYMTVWKYLHQLPFAQPLNPCETCLHKGKGWDEDPCDGCTGTESKYKPMVSPDGTLIVNVPKGTKVKRVIVLPYADG